MRILDAKYNLSEYFALRQYATIVDGYCNQITTGLEVSRRSSEARTVAKEIASDRNETVTLFDDDGDWDIDPDGTITPSDWPCYDADEIREALENHQER